MRCRCWGLLIELLELLYQVIVETTPTGGYSPILSVRSRPSGASLWCVLRAEEREGGGAQDLLLWRIVCSGIVLLPRCLYSQRSSFQEQKEALPVTQYLQSLCSLSFVLLQPQGSPLRCCRSQRLWGTSGQE